MASAASARGRRLGGLLLGTLLATVIAWSPGAVQPVLAAGPLGVRAATTYTVDPEDARIHVAVEYRVTNNKPNTPTRIYFYRTLSLGIQPDAFSVRASDGSGGLGVSTTRHETFTEVSVRLRSNLYYHRTSTFTLRYDLAGGAPRSESPIRVSRAFITFGVWAFGDPNQGTVEVRMPPRFTSTVDGSPMTTANSSSGNVLRASPADPDSFFAVITGENNAEYERERLSLGGGVNLAVLSWPEDDRWSEAVAETLIAGMPELIDQIGLPWPVDEDLEVRERYTPSLEGYAGFFFTEEERIDVTENLDPVTILHEASHAWFNENLFSKRWIYEGLAEEYSYRVQLAVGGETDGPPRRPDPDDEGEVPLNTWEFPQAVRDDTEERELYGYRTSFWVLHLIVEAAGEDVMREAFARAAGDLTAYAGEGPPEKVGPEDDWRRLLDLTQPIDEPEPAAVLDAIEEYVLGGGSREELGNRLGAREAYRQLLAAGESWTPPWYIREPMGRWRFTDATARMAAASTVLNLREDVEAAAAEEQLRLDLADLEAAYEGATSGFDDVTALANDLLATIESIDAAGSAVQAEPDLVSQIGLLGAVPPWTSYDAARAAFEAGDLAAARTAAEGAVAAVTQAAAAGQERIVLGAIVLLALVALLVFAVLLRRRRARRPMGVEPGSVAFLALDARFTPGAAATPAATTAAGPAPAAEPAAGPAPEPIGPAGTLGAHPDGRGSSLDDTPPADGGTT